MSNPIAVDRNGRKWYPYVIMNKRGNPLVSVHMEGADTDMGDLDLDELASYLGPVTIEVREKLT